VFLTLAGEKKKLWEIGRGKKYRAHKEIWDMNTGEKMPVDLWWTALRHLRSEQLLFLVKARVKKEVMYLITNDLVQTEAQAWDIFFTYRRRWQIETSFRYAKCKLALEGRATRSGEMEVVREQVFARGPVFREPDMFHPHTRQQILEQVAPTLEIASADQLASLLYADRQANYLLTDPGLAWTVETLLARYNLELSRGVLYWASQMTIEATSHYKDLWHFMKIFKLMFVAERKPTGGYRIDLDGPISPFVSSTLRYGRQFAAFLPALLLCEQWRMSALVRPPQAQGFLTYQLDDTCSLRSHFKGSGLFDSRLEADFAGEFATKVGDKRGHWLLSRESDVLLQGDTVMVPDFMLTDERDERRKVLVELVGFWHPEYLRRKVEKMRAVQCSHLLLLVSDRLNLTEQAFEDAPSEVIFFHEKPVLKQVMAAVEAIAERVYGPAPQKERKRARKQEEPDVS
jgi:predicted nuclease of restriction endonuclease-like RecB superfamily